MVLAERLASAEPEIGPSERSQANHRPVEHAQVSACQTGVISAGSAKTVHFHEIEGSSWPAGVTGCCAAIPDIAGKGRKCFTRPGIERGLGVRVPMAK